MIGRLIALAILLLASLLSCDSQLVVPDGSAGPSLPSRTGAPDGPSPSIEIPPPI
jgi:hypothetical protein